VHWLFGNWTEIGHTAVKVVLMYVTAVVALRLGERRTLAQWTIIDFATAVAIGAIIGRTATADNPSYASGAVALVILVAVHRLASLIRLRPVFTRFFDHRVRVLFADGRVRSHELRRCGLTENDLYAHLRQRGFFSLDSLQFVLYETKGGITAVPRAASAAEPLVDVALQNAADYPSREIDPAP
jgi:uncharacterized membrane protein YcaP (DUF421 family)